MCTIPHMLTSPKDNESRTTPFCTTFLIGRNKGEDGISASELQYDQMTHY